MSVSQSDLSNLHYGYDIVVATTQQSINKVIKRFLAENGDQPVTNLAFVATSSTDEYSLTDYESIMANAKETDPGFTDPFAIADGTDPAGSAAIQALAKQKFTAAVRLQLGLPKGMGTENAPTFVELPTRNGPVTFNMLCAQFQVVIYNPGTGFDPTPTWHNISQPDDTGWVYSALVDLNLTTVPASRYGDLPASVQREIKNLSGSAFSVQQLLFDFTNATLSASTPTLSGLPGKFKTTLNTLIVTDYFKALQAKGEPVVGVAVRRSTPSVSSLDITDLNFMVNPYIGSGGVPQPNPTADEQAVASLNYLCATNGASLPGANTFTWNWLDQQQAGQYDGVVAINRDALANFFRQQLTGFAAANCFNASVNVSLHGFLDTEVRYSWSMSRGQSPTVTTPASGAMVLSLTHASSSSDQAGLDGDMGRMTLSPSYTMTVTFSGDTIVIYQHLKVYLYVRSLATSASGNIIDKTITDTYTISVNADGRLSVSAPAVSRTDHSETPGTSGFLNFFTGLNSIIDDVKNWADDFVPTQFNDIPVSVAQSFVFPGGNSFAFKSASFSDDQDLVSLISYDT